MTKDQQATLEQAAVAVAERIKAVVGPGAWYGTIRARVRGGETETDNRRVTRRHIRAANRAKHGLLEDDTMWYLLSLSILAVLVAVQLHFKNYPEASFSFCALLILLLV